MVASLHGGLGKQKELAAQPGWEQSRPQAASVARILSFPNPYSAPFEANRASQFTWSAYFVCASALHSVGGLLHGQIR